MPIPSRFTVPVPECSVQKWVFGSSFDQLPDRKTYMDADNPDTRFLTFSDYRLYSKRVAVGLQRAGIKPGDRVLLFSPNDIFFPVIFMGVLMAGGIFTGANPTMVPRELTHQLKDSGAKLMITASGSVDIAREAAANVGLPNNRVYVFDATIPGTGRQETTATGGTKHWTELIAPEQDGVRFDWVEPADPKRTTCCLNYSSGTTGLPKGVAISHHSYVANGTGTISMADRMPDSEERLRRAVQLCFLPMYHAYGQTYFVTIHPRQGTPIYVMRSFDFVKFLGHVQRYRVTTLSCAPPIVVALVKHPATRKFDLSSVEQIGSGAAPLGSEVAREAERLFPEGKIQLRQGWGMTELTCTATYFDPLDERPSEGIGEVMPNCAAKIMMPDAKTEITKARTPGELWIAGPTIMQEYWRNEAATRETIVVDADGTRWLRTGDIGFVDNYEPGGIFFVVDRMKELIKVKGLQVAPAELEALLLERPDVVDVGVVGVTLRGEEMPRAYIVRAPDSKATGQDIARWLETRVAKHKRLQGGVEFIDAIPRNPSGKILRKILREKAKADIGDKDALTSKM